MSTTSTSTSGVDQRLGALQRVGADADRGGHPQAALLVLGGVRELDLLLDVLDRDQARQIAALVDDRQLLDLVAVQDLACASSRVVPTGAVIRFSLVMNSRDGLVEVVARSGGRGWSGCRPAGRPSR